VARTPSTMQALGTPLPQFELEDTEGRVFSSSRDLGPIGTLVIFMCNHCPFVVHLRETLATFTSEMIGRGLTVVGISSNDVDAYPQDGPEEMKRERKESGYEFPYLYDESQEVAKAFGAACTPDFFLYDHDQKLVYRGQFDESRPGNNSPVTGESLRMACESLMGTGKVSEKVEQRPSVGCNIKWRD
jgi:peroxiredoxin